MSTGRPSIYTEELAEEICDKLTDGLSLRQICDQAGMPDRRTVIRWQSSNESFAAKCARAREEQAEFMDDLILDVANNCTPETAQADRVKISAYQWRASKLKPKKYGDKLAVGGAEDLPPLRIQKLERVIVHANPDHPDRTDL